MHFTVKQAKEWLLQINDHMQEHKQELTRLDQAIGDGDHGINMARGFKEVVKKVNEKEYKTVGDIMQDAAMTIISKVGGAAGPLYGTAFLRMSLAFKDKVSIDYKTFTRGLDDALQGMKQRGKATTGEKTILDVWEPVVLFLEEGESFQPQALADTAKHAMEKTKNMIATKGRAAYFKEKSKGHIDPGAMSSYYIFLAMAEVLEEV
ncbi:dihydroxyacetone kinase subunit L [Cerasibacillus terrae]|uniref:phosphoenolpyruvate--glycerone phosphotransferase n=1 Tax=Cerasibacillus terrae TaxID=2498845 RepID=A0A5C8NKB3_9BACI|nr:dihydroxyacetone kinase subunit DhaL [Cerasibacillus terrae]TXL61718.1 dihydroxyacetone kinase subunit L [Cerasibacillus terrae]